jgi:hypothetical protein
MLGKSQRHHFNVSLNIRGFSSLILNFLSPENVARRFAIGFSTSDVEFLIRNVTCIQ